METWIQLIGNVGFPIAMVIYFLRRDWDRDMRAATREERLGSRIDQLEDAHRKEIVTLATDSVSAMKENNIHISQLTNAINALHDATRNRPCLLDSHTLSHHS